MNVEVNNIGYYIVKARTAIENIETSKLEFKGIERKFISENLIEAREAAFAFKNEFIYGILINIGLNDKQIGWNSKEKKIERLSDREVRAFINPFLEPETESEVTVLRIEEKELVIDNWIPPSDNLSWYPEYNNGIWVVFRTFDSDVSEGEEYIDLLIDKVSRYEEPLPSPTNFYNLINELEIYQKYSFDTKHYETTVKFFDDEASLDGGYSDKESLVTFDCLKTGFDWTGYDQKYWWEKDVEKILKNQEVPEKVRHLINEGESDLIEFKPTLINWNISERDIEYEVAKAICAFLNSKGGFLVIGVVDSGRVQGVDLGTLNEDEYKRKFTQLKLRFLPPHVAHSIVGKFYSMHEKKIFVIEIFPSQIEPIFLRKKVGEKTFKEFFVRSDAASRHLYDVEQIVKYCLSNWPK
jgi:predicted HTH transcriptional regulator